MLFYIIDAFTDKVFGGNPAGVVIYDKLAEENMQKLAAELRYSETAFIKPIDDTTFSIRFFTPNSEVDLCGHATMASFTALLQSEIIKSEGTYYMETLAGKLPVKVTKEFNMMEQAEPIADDPLNEYSDLAEIMGIKVNDIGDTNYNLKPQRVSTGLFDIMMPVKSLDILDKINPDMKRLSEYSKQHCVTGVHAYTLDGDSTAHCRNFAPLYDIDEEAATGTSNGALTYHLYLNGVLKAGDLNVFVQGEKMGRPSKITSTLLVEDKIKILVGGTSKILAKGELFL